MQNKLDSFIKFPAAYLSFWLFVVADTGAEAFVVKTHVAATTRTATSSLLTPAAVIPPHLVDSDTFSAITHHPSLVVSEGAIDVVKNIAIAVGGIIAVLAAFAILFSSFIIPAAADQLEKQAKELDPGMWQEYEQKLEPGETLATRPDLMQELGKKVQSKALAEFEKMEAAQKQASETTSSTSDIIDVEVLREEKKKDD